MNNCNTFSIMCPFQSFTGTTMHCTFDQQTRYRNHKQPSPIFRSETSFTVFWKAIVDRTMYFWTLALKNLLTVTSLMVYRSSKYALKSIFWQDPLVMNNTISRESDVIIICERFQPKLISESSVPAREETLMTGIARQHELGSCHLISAGQGKRPLLHRCHQNCQRLHSNTRNVRWACLCAFDIGNTPKTKDKARLPRKCLQSLYLCALVVNKYQRRVWRILVWPRYAIQKEWLTSQSLSVHRHYIATFLKLRYTDPITTST
jgi:hypothetical protein